MERTAYATMMMPMTMRMGSCTMRMFCCDVSKTCSSLPGVGKAAVRG